METPTPDGAHKAPGAPRDAGRLPDRLLNVHEAAELLGLKPATLYQWAYERRIAVVKPSGPRGPLRFRLRTLLALIDEWERPALRPMPDRD
jgi:excisionase family DNA binding protein